MEGGASPPGRWAFENWSSYGLRGGRGLEVCRGRRPAILCRRELEDLERERLRRDRRRRLTLLLRERSILSPDGDRFVRRPRRIGLKELSLRLVWRSSGSK